MSELKDHTEHGLKTFFVMLFGGVALVIGLVAYLAYNLVF